MFCFVFLGSASRIILQSQPTGLITPKQLNLCLWGWIDKMKNRVLPYITRLNITTHCFVAFKSTPFNAYASSVRPQIEYFPPDLTAQYWSHCGNLKLNKIEKKKKQRQHKFGEIGDNYFDRWPRLPEKTELICHFHIYYTKNKFWKKF